MDHEKMSERQLRATRILIVFSVVSAIDAAFGCQCAFAYRPFVSTDAAVADEHAWDIELGFVNLSQEDGQTTVVTPSLRVNYGLWKNWEVVGETDVQVYQEGPDRDGEIKEPGLFFKGVVREGGFSSTSKAQVSPLNPASCSLPQYKVRGGPGLRGWAWCQADCMISSTISIWAANWIGMN